jgi:hypothetical protein
MVVIAASLLSVWRECIVREFRCLTFELSGRQQQDTRLGLVKMYRVPPDRAWWPAVGAPLERGVRRHCALSFRSVMVILFNARSARVRRVSLYQSTAVV